MSLQVFNPAVANQVVVLNQDHRKIAKELIAQCIDEIKFVPQLTKSTPAKDEGDLARDRRLLDDLNRERGWKIKLKDYRFGRAILNADAETQKAAMFVALVQSTTNFNLDSISHRLMDELLKALLRKKLEYSDGEMDRLLILLAKNSVIPTSLPLASILSNVERHVQSNGLSKPVRRQLEKLTQYYHSGANYSVNRKAGGRIESMLALSESSQKNSASLEVTATNAPSVDLGTGEAWTDALLAKLGGLADESKDRWFELFEHCASAKSSKPTKKFFKRSRELLDLIGDGEFIRVIGPTLSAIGLPGECQRINCGGRIEYSEETVIHSVHVDRLRGIVWTTSLVDDEALIVVVGDAAEKSFQKIREVGPRSPKIGNACLTALASLASESAVAQLGRLKSRAKHVSTRKQIGKAFTQAASNAGMTEADLIELGVPRYDMTEVGSLREQFGDFTAVATVQANRKPELVWERSDGKTQKTVPAAIKESHAEQLKRLKKKLKDIEKLMPSVRQRVEHLFMNQRSWTLADFGKRFLDHPVVGVIARRLIWNITTDNESASVIWHDGEFKTAASEAISTCEGSSVSIWHPMDCSADEVLGWRKWLESNQVTQPLKQAHREVYMLTDAERTTVDYTNRFASHIIRQHQFAALCQQRGWRFDLQAKWDSWNAPFLDLDQHGLRVELFVNPLEGPGDVTEALVYTHLATEHVQFRRLEAGTLAGLKPVPLDQIPPLVFSEVMRDVDLFVGVTSVGNDPTWQERGVDEHAEYWEQFSFGVLSQTAITRKQTLESIVPRLSIADQCSFDGKFLVVQGKLRTYKIHLGSANILMSPDDSYLCIVQKRGSGSKRTDNLYLPFEGDNTLSMILSKAFMLADDDKIKDSAIANQIRQDRS